MYNPASVGVKVLSVNGNDITSSEVNPLPLQAFYNPSKPIWTHPSLIYLGMGIYKSMFNWDGYITSLSFNYSTVLIPGILDPAVVCNTVLYSVIDHGNWWELQFRISYLGTTYWPTANTLYTLTLGV